MQDKKKKIHVKKMRYAGLLLVVLLVFCGCTKKEELLLLSEEGPFSGQETNLPEEAQSGEALSAVTTENPNGKSEPPVLAKEGQGGDSVTSAETEASKNPGVIYVHVCGAVRQSGVYELRSGSRVYEAVQAAGGFAEGADQNYVNQAQELSDGVKLVIPTLEEALEAQVGIIGEAPVAETGGEEQAKDSAGKVNINTASEAQLCDIPGIGATRAAAIAAYRESHGRFQSPEDIMKVSGIKEGMYEKIKDSISVN